MGKPMGTEDEPLELSDVQVVEGEDGDEGEPAPESDEVIIAFADEADDGSEEEASPTVKRLREQNRNLARQLHQARKAPATQTDDLEPQIPARKRPEDFDYDAARFDEYDDARAVAIEEHAKWQVRQSVRESERRAAEEDHAKRIEQQKRALGVGDYDARVQAVKDRLTEQQLAVLAQASDNPARLLYALGRSEAKLEELASIDNLARFAARAGQMERDIKVVKKTAPPPEPQVRGATASFSMGDKKMEQLEREAEKTGDRSKLLAYRRELRRAQNAA